MKAKACQEKLVSAMRPRKKEKSLRNTFYFPNFGFGFSLKTKSLKQSLPRLNGPSKLTASLTFKLWVFRRCFLYTEGLFLLSFPFVTYFSLQKWIDQILDILLSLVNDVSMKPVLADSTLNPGKQFWKHFLKGFII